MHTVTCAGRNTACARGSALKHTCATHLVHVLILPRSQRVPPSHVLVPSNAHDRNKAGLKRGKLVAESSSDSTSEKPNLVDERRVPSRFPEVPKSGELLRQKRSASVFVIVLVRGRVVVLEGEGVAPSTHQMLHFVANSDGGGRS